MVKTCLVNSFPNVDSPVTLTTQQLNHPIPSGLVAMWSGALAMVPSGWALCDGTQGTPDLRDRFVVGAGNSYAVGASGGATLTTPAGSHTHTINNAGSHNHSGQTGDTNLNTTVGVTGGGASNAVLSGTHHHSLSTDGDHNHTVNLIGDHQHTALPPYLALAYIMKL